MEPQLQQPPAKPPQNSQQIAAEQQNVLGQLQTEKEAGARAQADIDVNQAQGQQRVAEGQATQARALQEQRKAETKDFGAFVPTQESGSDLMKMFSLVATLGFMSGGHGRGAGLSAMKNMTAALQGHREGREDVFNRELTEFKENMAAAKAHNDNVDKLYREGMDLLTVDRDAALAKLKVAATIDGRDSVLAHTIKSGNLEQSYKLLDDRRKAMEKFEQSVANREAQFEMQKKLAVFKQSLQQVGAGLDQQESAYLAAMASKNPDLFSKMTSGWSKNPLKLQGVKAAIQEAMQNNISPEGWVDHMTNRIMDIRGAGQAAGVFAKSDPFVRLTHETGQMVKDLNAEFKRTGSPLVNRSYIWLTQHANQDPKIADWLDTVRTHINEYARATSSATGSGVSTDTARKEIESTLNGAMSMEAVDRVIDRHMKILEKRQEQFGRSREKLLETDKKSGGFGERSPNSGTQEDQEAIAWARQNSGDPRAKKILQMHGVQ